MGSPILNASEVPSTLPGNAEGTAIAVPLEVAGSQWTVTAVGMGNPHAVVYSRDGEDVKVWLPPIASCSHPQTQPLHSYNVTMLCDCCTPHADHQPHQNLELFACVPDYPAAFDPSPRWMHQIKAYRRSTDQDIMHLLTISAAENHLLPPILSLRDDPLAQHPSTGILPHRP